MPANTPLSEQQIQEIRARLENLARFKRSFAPGVNTQQTLDERADAEALDALLTDHARLTAENDALRAAAGAILTTERGHTFGIGTDWRVQYDRVLRSVAALAAPDRAPEGR